MIARLIYSRARASLSPLTMQANVDSLGSYFPTLCRSAWSVPLPVFSACGRAAAKQRDKQPDKHAPLSNLGLGLDMIIRRIQD